MNFSRRASRVSCQFRNAQRGGDGVKRCRSRGNADRDVGDLDKTGVIEKRVRSHHNSSANHTHRAGRAEDFDQADQHLPPVDSADFRPQQTAEG